MSKAIERITYAAAHEALTSVLGRGDFKCEDQGLEWRVVVVERKSTDEAGIKWRVAFGVRVIDALNANIAPEQVDWIAHNAGKHAEILFKGWERRPALFSSALKFEPDSGDHVVSKGPWRISSWVVREPDDKVWRTK